MGSTKLVWLTVAVLGLFGSCGSPPGPVNEGPTLAANPAINATTSYGRLLQTKHLFPTRIPLARTYFSLHADGVEDLISVDLTGTVVATAVRFWKNDGQDRFTEEGELLGSQAPSLVHGRKAITTDLDADGWEDVVIAGHGYDQPPFPGEVPLVIHNGAGKSLQGVALPLPAGFYHSVCSGDVNNDGFPDLFFTPGIFLMNDRKGGFLADPSMFPGDLTNQGGYYTSELYDLNGDGYLDLVVAGHEHEGAPSRILWGSGSGKYDKARSSELPAVAGHGVVVGISLGDTNGDGKVDILLNRTGDPSGPGFYHGYFLQLIDGGTLGDVTSLRIPNNASSTDPWCYWVRFYDLNKDGAPDIVVDDASAGLAWIKDPTGTFRR